MKNGDFSLKYSPKIQIPPESNNNCCVSFSHYRTTFGNDFESIGQKTWKLLKKSADLFMKNVDFSLKDAPKIQIPPESNN
ncbi:hypothetical protein, partial [Staphylococcus aureus]|uniref:hypothetical protein n=1 Tax=Staphylococcus aureus TaxID=1280 RepID=UPI0019D29809